MSSCRTELIDIHNYDPIGSFDPRYKKRNEKKKKKTSPNSITDLFLYNPPCVKSIIIDVLPHFQQNDVLRRTLP